jgi:hypothetical protein
MEWEANLPVSFRKLDFGQLVGEFGHELGVGLEPGRVGPGVDFLEHPDRDLGVNLGRLQLLVPEELLDEADGLRLLRWSHALDDLLAKADRSKAEASRAPKAASWKVELAWQMRRLTGASIPWIARELCMGTPGSLRVYLSRSASSKN